jgi:hypothetical protein
MTLLRRSAPVLALAALASFGAQAAGEHFTLTVPYATYAVPQDIRSMRITCAVTGSGGASDVIALADHDFTIPVGGDTGSRTAVLRFNAKPGKDPAKAVRYKCNLYEPFGKFIAQDSRNPSTLEVSGPIGAARP